MSPRRRKTAGAESPRGLEQRLLTRWRALDVSDGRPLIVGFSGGPDSLALAACLARIAPLMSVEVRLLHVDHGLRPSSAQEAVYAQSLAAELGLGYQSVQIDPDALTQHPGTGVEEAARRERYRLFANIVASNNAAMITLGHHQMDQAETVLLHLLRGAGLRGAAGMASLSEIDVPWWTDDPSTDRRRLRIWRPFLGESRDVVRNYASQTGLTPIEDESNESNQFRRNALRLDLLPLMERLSPGAVSSLANFAALAAEDDRYLTELAGQVLHNARRNNRGLSVDVLNAAPLSLRRRALYMWLGEFAGLEPNHERIEAIIQLIRQPARGASLEIGGGYRARIVDDYLSIVREDRTSGTIDS